MTSRDHNKPDVEVDRAFSGIDHRANSVPLTNSSYRGAFALIRKRVMFGLLGNVYIFERRKRNSQKAMPGRITLYGGSVELTNPNESESWESSKQTVCREFKEELGGVFDISDFEHRTTIIGDRASGRDLAADIFELPPDGAEHIRTKQIRAHQRQAAIDLAIAQNELTKVEHKDPNDPGLDDIRKRITELQQITAAGRPMKIHEWNGVIFFRSWHKMAPMAAYALLNDVRNRRRRKNKK